MRQWIIRKGASSIDDLMLIDAPAPVVQAGEVLIEPHAWSLNYRDQAIVQGNYFGGQVSADQVPLSDGAGIVVAVGEGVTRFSPGDRVAGLFFQNWAGGPPRADSGPALGAPPAKGMLAEQVALPEIGVTSIPSSLSFEEAATLPCAGATAWNALFGARPIVAGETVLVIGTGGVSLLAMQIAKAAGAKLVVTSSSDEKLERARALGASVTVNYRQHPEWAQKVLELTGGHGADKVIEVGGVGTLGQSMQAVAFGGEIALIGVLTQGDPPNPHGLMMKGASLRGIFVGSGAMMADLCAFIDQHQVKPVIGRSFGFEQAADAYRYQASPALFGKVVITRTQA